MIVKRFFNCIRHDYAVSAVARNTLSPVQRVCSYLDQQIRMKIWVNGGKVVYDGIDLHFPKDVGVSYCSNIFWQGANGYEPHTWTVVKHFALHCDTFLDVGSNVGLYSVLVKKLNPRVRVEAFEPIPTIYHKNILFHRANGLDGENVWGHAVGDRDGQATIYLPVDSSSIEEETTATLRQDSWQGISRMLEHPGHFQEKTGTKIPYQKHHLHCHDMICDCHKRFS